MDEAPDAPLSEYDALVEKYGESFKTGHAFNWYEVVDARTPVRRVMRRRWWRLRATPDAVYETVLMTNVMAHASRVLRDCHDDLPSLDLPADSPIPEQVRAARHRLCEVADLVRGRYAAAWDARYAVEHDQAVQMAAQVAAVVSLARQREAVLGSIDTDSLRRTAEALSADLAAARAHLNTDPLDRKLEAAAKD